MVRFTVYPNVGALVGDVIVDVPRGAGVEAVALAICKSAYAGVPPEGIKLRLFGTGRLAGVPLTSDLRLHRAVLHCAGRIVCTAASGLPPRLTLPAAGVSASAPKRVGSDQPRYDPALTAGHRVPEIEADDPELASLMHYPVPLVIRNSKLLGRAVDLWNFDYLDRHFADVGPFIVMRAPAESEGRFAYYDMSPSKNPCNHPVKNPVEKIERRFCEFRREVARLRRAASSKGRAMVYLQNTLLHREEEEPGRARFVGGFGSTCGKQVAADIGDFKWEWLEKMMGGRHVQICQLFCGTAGGFSPCHYDPQDNIFAQVSGFKRVLLFHPKHFGKLYPWPVHHPQDRQSRVNFDAPDLTSFPRFSELAGEGLEAILGPGDLLRIPPGWWHHVEMLRGPDEPDGSPGEEVVSINFWFPPPAWHHGSIEDGTLSWDHPLYGVKRVLFQRCVEELIAKLCGPHRVADMLSRLCRSTADAGEESVFADPALQEESPYAHVLNFVATVFPRMADRAEFLREMVAGRFEGLSFQGE